MRTVGIIAEYNPFHTGHAYHIRKAKEQSGADYAVVVMSPDFVQRGEPAVFDKYTRARMALLNGADLVIELPVCYATGSAEYFAEGGVAMLDRLGVIDALCFGAETADPELFCRVSGILAEEPRDYAGFLRKMLRQGKTYPQARSESLIRCLNDPDAAQAVREFLSCPNNILGTEYCKALRRQGSRIVPLPVRREGSRYESLSLEGSYSSASALRSGIASKAGPELLLRHIPENCHELFLQVCRHAVTQEELLPYLTQKLLSCDSFDQFFDISSDLSDRMCARRYACIGKTYDQAVAILRTRQITEVHIRRALLHLILDLRSEDVRTFRRSGTVFYAKVLGLRRDAAPLLHQIRERCQVPFITKPTHAAALPDEPAGRMWKLDLFASHLYRGIQSGRTHADFRSEYEISPVIL